MTDSAAISAYWDAAALGFAGGGGVRNSCT